MPNSLQARVQFGQRLLSGLGPGLARDDRLLRLPLSATPTMRSLFPFW